MKVGILVINGIITETNKSYPGAFRPHFDFVNLKISLVCFYVFSTIVINYINSSFLSFASGL